MQNIEAIIFDLGGVILNIDYQSTRKAFEKAGIANFNDMYSQAAADDLFDDLETGKIAPAEFYKKLNERAGVQLTESDIRQAWNAMLLDFREESLAHISSLKSKYKLYLLSNTNHIHLVAFNDIYRSKHRDIPFADHFIKAYYSCEMGLRKPNADIFEFVLAENQLDPSTTVFIDDSVQNIATAKAVGLQTILLEAGQKIEDLPF